MLYPHKQRHVNENEDRRKAVMTMRILIAAPDRDLLTAYDKLLTGSGHAVVTAFDGTQVMRLLAGRGVDLAILDRCLPRADVGAVTAALRRESTRSASLRWLTSRDAPGRRRSSSAWIRSPSRCRPGGHPSITTPRPPPWLSPNVVTRNTAPMVLPIPPHVST